MKFGACQNRGAASRILGGYANKSDFQRSHASNFGHSRITCDASDLSPISVFEFGRTGSIPFSAVPDDKLVDFAWDTLRFK